MNRRYIAAVAVVALSAMAGTSANAATVVVPQGTADTVVDLAELAISGLPVDGVSIGQVRSFASTDTDATYNPVGKGKPFALAKVSLPDGTSQSVRSDGDTGSAGKSVPIGDVGALTIGDLTATAGDEAAQSVVNAVEGQVDAVVAGLKARAAGVNAKVGNDGSSTTNGVVVENVSIGLTDILPADLLAQLPLDKLIKLRDLLKLNVDLGPLNDTLDEVRKLADSVDDLVDTEQAISDAEAQIDVLRATMGGGVAAAQQNVDAAQAALDSESSTLTDLNGTLQSLQSQWQSTGCDTLSILPGCSDIQASIAAAQQDIASQEAVVAAKQAALGEAQAALAAAQKGVAAVQGEIDKLQAQVDDLVKLVDGLLDDIVKLARNVAKLDLEGLLDALLGGLEGVELVGIDRMSFGVSTMATATDSKATTICDVAGVRVLGEARDTASCDDVRGAIGEVEQTLKDLLAALPVKGVVPADAVNVDGPRMSSSPEGYAAEGYRIASAKVSGLDLVVAPIKLTQVVDSLVVQARALVSGTLAQLEAATGVQVPVDVNAALDELLAQLNGLPVGDVLEGVSTPRVAISAVDLGSRSTFRASGSGVDGHPVGGSPTPVTPAGNLPHTGGGVGMALLLLAAGGTAWGVIRPRRQTGEA